MDFLFEQDSILYIGLAGVAFAFLFVIVVTLTSERKPKQLPEFAEREELFNGFVNASTTSIRQLSNALGHIASEIKQLKAKVPDLQERVPWILDRTLETGFSHLGKAQAIFEYQVKSANAKALSKKDLDKQLSLFAEIEEYWQKGIHATEALYEYLATLDLDPAATEEQLLHCPSAVDDSSSIHNPVLRRLYSELQSAEVYMLAHTPWLSHEAWEALDRAESAVLDTYQNLDDDLVAKAHTTIAKVMERAHQEIVAGKRNPTFSPREYCIFPSNYVNLMEYLEKPTPGYGGFYTPPSNQATESPTS